MEDNKKPDECRTFPPEEYPLWAIVYTIDASKGMAIVRASDAREAERLLRAGSQFNGISSQMKIQSIEEVIPRHDKGIALEMYYIYPEVISN